MAALLRLYLRLLIKLHEFIEARINAAAIGLNGGIHPKHDLTRYHDFFVENITPQATVLDVGSGNGYVASKMAAKARRVVGIDICPAHVRMARERFPAGNLQFVDGDVTTFPFDETFDYIVLSNVLEHIEDRRTLLKKLATLAPALLIRVPMFNRDWLTLYKQQLGLFAFCDPTHFTEYTVESFEAEMKEAGFRVTRLSVQFGEIWAAASRA